MLTCAQDVWRLAKRQFPIKADLHNRPKPIEMNSRALMALVINSSAWAAAAPV